MKVFILTSELTGSGPVWMNIFWPHYNAISESVPTVLLTTPDNLYVSGGIRGRLGALRQRREYRNRLMGEVMDQLDPEGPNILLVWALRPRDIQRALLLDPVWNRFSHKVLSVVDNLAPEHVLQNIRDRYDLITCFCGDLADEFGQSTGTRSIFFPPHTDALNFSEPGGYRPVDLFVVGRRRPDMHVPLHRHFNAPGRPRISVDFISRSVNFSASSEVEFRLLIAAYARSKLSFCFEASAVDRFRNRSPLTERWIHSWTAGCTVVGTTPTGKGVKDEMDWAEATIDLPDAPDQAIEFVEALLQDEDALRRRRLRNIEETMRRHDTRHRLARLMTDLDLPFPDGLRSGLTRLEQQADGLAARQDIL